MGFLVVLIHSSLYYHQLFSGWGFLCDVSHMVIAFCTLISIQFFFVSLLSVFLLHQSVNLRDDFSFCKIALFL